MKLSRCLSMLLVLLLGLPALGYGLEVKVLKKATVQGEVITLGEVAHISGHSDLERALAQQTLFRSPAPGRSADYSASDLRDYLVQSDPELARVRWTGAKTVHVTRAGITIGPGKIAVYIRDFIKRKRAFLPPAQVSFQPSNPPLPFVLPEGKLTCDVIPANPRILGSHRFTLIFRVDGRVVKNMVVGGELRAVAKVAVAALDLPRGSVLSADDLQLAPLDLTTLRSPCLSLKDLLGKRLKRSVRMGTAIDRSIVEFPPLVKRGDVVTITAQKGALAVTATGVAGRDGREGEVIPVRNTNSGRKILCKVTAPDNVQVEF